MTMDRIAATKYSLRAFGCAIAGFILLIGVMPILWALGAWGQNPSAPKDLIGVLAGCACLIGVVPAMYATLCWLLVSRRYRSEWNPASAYLSFGAFLSVLTLLLAILVSLAITVSLA